MNLTEGDTFSGIFYFGFFTLATVFSILINGLLLKFSRTLGDRDEQNRNVVRWSSQIKPSIGGFSFYIIFLMSLSAYGIFPFSGQEYMNVHMLGMVITVTIGFLIGLADDAYNTYPLLKFGGQLLCGSFLVATNTMIHATGIYVVDVLLTIIWVIGIMNSINMLDNMDGISGTVSFCILLSCLLGLLGDKSLFSFYSLMLLAVSGALVGFLVFNWHPARIYMGDTGSQFLGAFLSVISIQLLWNFHDPGGPVFQFRQFLIPLIAFSIPIIDTTTVFFRRIARGQSPFVGGRDHISHHFAYAGLSDKQVTYVLGGISLVSGVIAAFMILEGAQISSLFTFSVLAYFLLLFIAVQFFYEKGTKKESVRKAENVVAATTT
ncbi:MAG: undecaprenyl/decaprenyl-phosphate alpha-N-acetylglucosaminyl 1-phosphate transferase [Chitinophagales bacterium]|nr:undecaprenyl/decaprenyl-phosphate alpha-N-acetylglucosaminyl 1-phosphate transferase [Chitinophagales bacterium]